MTDWLIKTVRLFQESLSTQHRLIILDTCIRSRKRVVIKMYPKTMWRDLKGERAKIFKGKVTEEGDCNFEGETTTMWKQMANCIRTVAKKVFRESKGKRHYNKETWWSVEVKEVVRDETLQSLARD